MIGSLQNAMVAKEINQNNPWGGIGDKYPGWSFLDSGSYRSVYRGPDGNVYKIDTRDPKAAEQYGNRAEWSAFLEWTERVKPPKTVVLNPCYLHANGVLAAPFVEAGDAWGGIYDQQWENHLIEACKEAYIWPRDMHGGNVRYGIDGKVVIIDYGHFAMSPEINWWMIERRAEHIQMFKENPACPCGCGAILR